MPATTARRPLHPSQSAPQLNVYDPAGKPVAPVMEKKSVEINMTTNKDISPPMFRCGDDLCIVSGDDVFPLPKEMDVPHWGCDYGGLFNYQQVPTTSWPPRVSPRLRERTILIYSCRYNLSTWRTRQMAV